jgi:mannose-6-phosphate isomerase-like protein (cupin superfamily)
MKVEQWDESRDGALTESALRRKLESLGYRVSRWVYPPGTVFDFHSHGYDKMDAVVSGRFRMTMHGESVVLGPGDALPVPAGASHRAEVVGSESVISLDGERS